MGWNWYTPFAPFINILLSAAIGYITNYIAIEMLFKPYYEKKSHPLSIITFGYWKQGLIPRNKNHIGKELGHQIETKLLNPENMANELCDMVMGFIQDPKIIEKLRNAIQNMLHNHEKSILDFLTPQIENSLQTALDKILTKENINNFWKDEIEPLLMHEEHRNFIALQIRKSLQNRTPQLTKILKEELKKITPKKEINPIIYQIKNKQTKITTKTIFAAIKFAHYVLPIPQSSPNELLQTRCS